MRVLIVDDTSILRLVLKDVMVKNCGIDKDDVFEASTGRAAVDEYKKRNPDIVFLDIAMPDFDGKYVIEKILNLDPLAKVVMCTSSHDKSDIETFLTIGAIDYIIKPPQPDRVKAAFDKVAAATVTQAMQFPHLSLPSLSPGPFPAPPAVRTNDMYTEVEILKAEVTELKRQVAEVKNQLQNKGDSV
ncbi:MAG: response regulator [Oscillospiraceae bacterium]|nr:response regulator [Oscillospiraceae bacterium]